MVNGKWLPDFIERLKASAWHQLYLPLLPFTHARSEFINADSLKLQLLTARKKECVTIRPQFAIECLQRSNQQGWVTLGPNLGVFPLEQTVKLGLQRANVPG